MLERTRRVLRLVDAGRLLGDPQRDELGPELVQITGKGTLLRHLAKRGDRDRVANVPTACDHGARIVERQPRTTAGSTLERAEIAPGACRGLGREHREEDVTVRMSLSGRGDALEVGNEIRLHRARIERWKIRRRRHALGLFAPLAPSYDRVGAVLSFGQDPRWRRFLVSQVPSDGGHVLDVATGTGLVAELLLRDGHVVTGLDQSPEMLAAARARVDGRAELVEASAEALPFPDASFDHLTFTYLLRYVDDPGAVLRELARVVRPGGTIAMLEFGLPRGLVRPLWELYVRVGLPVAGRAISQGWYDVGRFLGPSIRGFWEQLPERALLELWSEAGIGGVHGRRLSLGGGIVIWGTMRS